MKYTKNEAIIASRKFLKEVQKIEKKFGISISSDEADIYLQFRSSEEDKHWDVVHIGWDGDGTPLKVTDRIENKEYYKEQALAKLSDEEKDALDLK